MSQLMHAAQVPTALFKPSRFAEEHKAYWQPSFSQAAVASASRLSGFGAVQPVGRSGNDFNDALAQIHNNFIDLVGEFTGSNAQARAQQDAITLAQVNAQRSEQQAYFSSQFWTSMRWPLVIGGVAGLGLILIAAVKK